MSNMCLCWCHCVLQDFGDVMIQDIHQLQPQTLNLPKPACQTFNSVFTAGCDLRRKPRPRACVLSKPNFVLQQRLAKAVHAYLRVIILLDMCYLSFLHLLLLLLLLMVLFLLLVLPRIHIPKPLAFEPLRIRSTLKPQP